jgi:hypothetical protein
MKRRRTTWVRLVNLIRGVAPEMLRNNRCTRSPAFVQYLCLAMTPDHSQAKRSVEWAENCLRDWRNQGAEPDWHQLDTAEKARFILSLIERIADDLCNRHQDDEPWFLGFSSGLDSRLLHYVLRRRRVALQTYTYGQPGNLDFDFSKSAAERLELDTIFFDTTQLPWSLEFVDRMTATARDRPISPRIVCAQELLDRIGRPYFEIHGFLNDRLTGVGLPTAPSQDWSCAVAHALKANDQFGLGSFFRPDVLGSLYPRKPLSDSLPFDLQIDIAYRQFQRIRPGEIKGVTYLCPYTDPRWVGFWLHRSFDELTEQRLYVDTLLASRIPEFFDLTQLEGEGRDTTKKGRLELMYGNGKKRREFAQSQGVQAPLAATSHFCTFACYRNNAGFARYADQSLRRLRSRGLFHASFLDDVSRRFVQGDGQAEKITKGLLSIDSCMEMDLLI